jgi:Uma2 family endonuclease
MTRMWARHFLGGGDGNGGRRYIWIGSFHLSEAAVKRMTVSEFLRWEDGTDTRYELRDGVVVAMAPPATAHGFLAARVCARIGGVLQSRRPCMVQVEASTALPERDDTCYVADLAVTCTPPLRGDQLIRDPLLIVEVLSPTTGLYDRQVKAANYRRIPSVEEILLIDSAASSQNCSDAKATAGSPRSPAVPKRRYHSPSSGSLQPCPICTKGSTYPIRPW